MSYIFALITAAIAVIGLALGLNFGLDSSLFNAADYGLGSIPAWLNTFTKQYDKWLVAGGFALAAMLVGFVLNFILSRLVGGAGFFTMLKGFFFGVFALLVAGYLGLIGYGTYAGTTDPSNATLFFFIFQIPYIFAFDTLGATATGIILMLLGALAAFVGLSSIANGDDDDDE